MVSGYSHGAYFPEQFSFEFPSNIELTELRPNRENGEPNFGVDWFGMTDAITRLIKGFDIPFINRLAEYIQAPENQVGELEKLVQHIISLLPQVEYPIAFEGMPLQDAVDFAVYLVEVTIGRYRFGVGAPLCGGEVDVAVISSRGFNWVYRKNWHVSGRGANHE